jgi:hypothetical protein
MVVGGFVGVEVLWLVFGGEIEAGAGPGAAVLEDRVLLLPIYVVSGGNLIAGVLNLQPDHPKLLRTGIGSGARSVA